MKLRRARRIRGPALLVLSCWCVCSATPCVAAAQTGDIYNYKPEGGYVNKSEIAIAIANIILNSIYSERIIIAEQPLIAKLNPNDIWVVTGSFKQRPGTYISGGVAEIWISKSDGRILRVSHGE
jgi:hypothetical protein